MSLVRRYHMMKFWNAVEAGLHNLVAPASSSSGSAGGFRGGPGASPASSSSSSIDSSSDASSRSSSSSTSSSKSPTSTSASDHIFSAISKFKEAYNQQLTSVMYMAGTAMAPALNKAGLEDRDALEKLVVRSIPRPSSRTVLVGDVVAFNSPLTLGTSSDSNEFIMVRRVAAMEGDEMVASSSGQQPVAEEEEEDAADVEDLGQVPQGHCWVLADNENLKPSEVGVGWAVCLHTCRVYCT